MDTGISFLIVLHKLLDSCPEQERARISEKSKKQFDIVGTSLTAQQLKLGAYTPEGTSLIPGQGTKILHAVRCVAKNIFKLKKEKKRI